MMQLMARWSEKLYSCRVCVLLTNEMHIMTIPSIQELEQIEIIFDSTV